jgi:hypothetical protein
LGARCRLCHRPSNRSHRCCTAFALRFQLGSAVVVYMEGVWRVLEGL